jgi:hypothetical protein
MSRTNRPGTRSSARLGVVLFAIAALMSFGVGLTFAAPGFNVTIYEPISVEGNTVTLNGIANSPLHAFHHIEINWGDGDVDVFPDFASLNGPWTWGPVSNTYFTDGRYMITVKLFYSAGETDHERDIDRVRVTIGDGEGGGCGRRCPVGDDGSDDGGDDGSDEGQVDGNSDGGNGDGLVDDGVVDGSVDGSIEGPADGTVEAEVLGTVITKKPAAEVKAAGQLAKTGPETAGLTVLGLMLLMAGVTIRFITDGNEGTAFVTVPPSSGDPMHHAFKRNSRGRTCSG